MTDRAPIITDHALLRYLERVVGIDVGSHRRDMEEKLARAVELEAAALVSDGWRYTIIGCHVTTVMPRGRQLVSPRLRFERGER
jgi:hypothetical protein